MNTNNPAPSPTCDLPPPISQLPSPIRDLPLVLRGSAQRSEEGSPARSARRGATLVSLIAVMVILGVLGVSVIALTHTSEHTHLSANAGSRAYYIADSGLRYAQVRDYGERKNGAVGWLQHGRQHTLSLDGGREVVEILRIVDTYIATATVDAGTALQARARVQGTLDPSGVPPLPAPSDSKAIFGEVAISLGTQAVIQGDVAIIDGSVEIKGTVEGSVLAADVTILSNDARIEGSIISSGFVEAKGTITGDIHSATGMNLSSDSVVEGWLFSQGDITVQAGATVLGSIHSCGGDVNLQGNPSSGSEIGTESNRIEIRASGDVTLSGTAVVWGNVYAGGSIIMTGSASINGYAYAKVAITKGNNNTITLGEFVDPSGNQILPPICPDLTDVADLELPPKTIFTAGGDDKSVTAEVPFLELDPGSYGVLTLPSNPSAGTGVVLKSIADGPAEYRFTGVTSSGSQTTLYLNLSASAENEIRVFVTGNVDIKPTINVYVSTDGSNYYSVADLFPGWLADPPVDTPIARSQASRVYWEAHGTFELGGSSQWFGSVYTPDPHPPKQSLKVGNTSNLIGSFYSGGGHNLGGSTVKVIHVAPDYFKEQ